MLEKNLIVKEIQTEKSKNHIILLKIELRYKFNTRLGPRLSLSLSPAFFVPN